MNKVKMDSQRRNEREISQVRDWSIKVFGLFSLFSGLSIGLYHYFHKKALKSIFHKYQKSKRVKNPEKSYQNGNLLF